MEVSKLTVSKDLRHQTSSVTKLMLWMQKNPKRCKQTNARALLNTFLLDKDTDVNVTFLSLEQYFHKALKKGLIERRNGTRKADFLINYYHPDLPAQVREARPEDEETNGPVLVTTEAEPKPESEPEAETQSDEPHTIVDVDKEIREEIAESDAPDTEEPEPIISEPISIKAGDGEIKLSITLNINIAR